MKITKLIELKKEMGNKAFKSSIKEADKDLEKAKKSSKKEHKNK